MKSEHILTLTGIAHSGDALGRLPDGRAAFVPFGLPGEVVRIQITEDTPRFVRGKLVEIIAPVEKRIQPRCPHFTVCGGCQFQHMDYQDQVTAKVDSLKVQLTRTGGITNIPLLPVVTSPSIWKYRNLVQFQTNSDGALGFGSAETKQVVPIAECHLIDPQIDSIWHQLDFEPIPDLTNLQIRIGTNDALLILESHVPDPPELEIDFPLSVVHLSGDSRKVLADRDYVLIEIHERYFKVSAESFFRVNTAITEKMVTYILDQLPANLDTVIDLYCGTGLFSAFLAERAGQVIGVESSEAACNDFIDNLDEFDNVALYAAPVLDALNALPTNPDLIIVDPPLSGLGKHVTTMITTKSPEQIIYISGNPTTLARDAQRLQESGYSLSQITPFDLLPQTYHIETISFWRKANG